MTRRRKLSPADMIGLEELTAGPSAPAGPASPSVRRLTNATPEQFVVELPLDSITPNPHQPRRDFTDEQLASLAASITRRGRVLQPIVVRRAPDADGYQLVAGERRWRASRLAGLATISAIVITVEDADSAELALVENMVRVDLTPIEAAAGCAALRDNFKLTVTEIAERLGRERSGLAHLIRLLDLPDTAQALITAGRLSEGHGRILLRITDDFDAQARFARHCADEGWTVRQLEREVDAYRRRDETPDVPRAARPADEEAALRALTEKLQPVYRGEVKLVPRRHGTYELQVRYADFDALSKAVLRLETSPPEASGDDA